jgi:cell fate regulator YaaT (PSP1 superfamily)
MDHLDYLVAHGLFGHFGRFRAAAALDLPRGSAVVIRSDRGMEIGRVLRPATSRHAVFLPNTTVGALLRAAGPDDTALASRMAVRAEELLARGEQLIQTLGLPVALFDAEVLLDGKRAVVQHLRWGSTDVRELVSTLARELDMVIELVDVGAPAVEEDHGCGSCGSGGGCGSCGSSGGCGSCGSARPEEVRAYFSELREKMERRVPLL